jgi:hypothetical protein
VSGQSAARKTYLIEHYRAGADVDELTISASKVRDAVAQMEREGRPIRLLSSTIVGADSYLASVVEALDEETAREAFGRAGISIDRILAAITADRSSKDV